MTESTMESTGCSGVREKAVAFHFPVLVPFLFRCYEMGHCGAMKMEGDKATKVNTWTPIFILPHLSDLGKYLSLNALLCKVRLIILIGEDYGKD